MNLNGAIYLNTITQNNLSAGTYSIVNIDKNTGTACYFDYRVSETSSGACRAGTIMAVWTNTNTQYTDTSTLDIISNTDAVSFYVDIVDSNAVSVSYTHLTLPTNREV